MAQNYKLTLVNVWWTENGIDNRFFDSISDQKTYFDDLMEGVSTPFVNFQMENNIDTRVTYKENSARSVEEIMRCNYCVVQKFNEEKDTEIERRYFFAYPRKQDSQGQVIVDLSLDDIQTNYFRHKSTIAPCQIMRSHLDRWVDNLNDTISFNGNITSKLFEREQITEVAKRLTHRTKLNLKVSDSDAINQWYNSNILGWVYVYCDARKYKIYEGANVVELTLNPPFREGVNGLKIPLGVFAYPVFKNDNDTTTPKYILNRKTGGLVQVEYRVNSVGFSYFRTLNEGSSYIKSTKFSILPPIYFNSSFTTIEQNVLVLTNCTEYNGYFNFTNFTNNYGLMGVINYKSTFETEPYVVNKNLTFYKSVIINGTKNPSYNPKLLNSDYFELKITNERGNGFSYDFQKLNNKNLTLLYTEVLTPDITRSYLRIKDPTGVYIQETDENLTGLVDSADMSLMVDNDQLSQMLANNKNFYLQNYLNVGEKALMGAVGGAIAGGGIGGVITSSVNAGMSIANMYLSIDNMRNAPKDLKNSNGNAYFNTSYCEPGLYVEEYEILENEKKIINDTMFMNGYSTNLIGNVSDYDNIRKVFNYLSANVETITASISNDEKERLKQKLLNIRFWNTDTIDYENAKNYERWLNNE